MLALLPTADCATFNNDHGFLIFRRQGGRLNNFFVLFPRQRGSQESAHVGPGKQSSDLREATDARVTFLVWEQEERVWRESGQGSRLQSHAEAELQKREAAAGGVINAGPLAVTSHCLI